MAQFSDDAMRRQERLRRRTTRMDNLFAFAPAGGQASDIQPLFGRSEAEQRASTILAARIKALPAIVIEASKPGGPEIESLETAIEQNPALAAAVLAGGGAEVFARGGPRANNIGELLERVGAAAFRSLTFCATMFSEFADPLSWYAYDARGLWRHTTAAAIAAWRIGEALGFHTIANEGIFLAALFHDIGKPIIQGMLDDGMPSAEEVSLGRTLGILESERRIVSMTHSELVPLILDIWGVEHSIFATAEHHHTPQRAGTHAIQATIVQVGDMIANVAGIGLEREYPFVGGTTEQAAARLNLPPATCRQIQEGLGLAVAELLTEFEGARG